MNLTAEQIAEYDERGFVVLHDVFSVEEIDGLNAQLAEVAKVSDPRVIREKSGEAVRMIYGVHDLSAPTGSRIYENLVNSARILKPAMQILKDKVNVYHTKINLKEAVNGEFWQWHQDFGYWHTDGAAEPDMITALVFLDRATEMGGCLYFIPGSHKMGLIPPYLDEQTSVKLWSVPKPTVVAAVEKYGEPVAITGNPGSVVLFHPLIVHGSGHNMSTHDRRQFYCVYNAEKNKLKPVSNPRPEYNAARNAPTLKLSEREEALV